MAMPRRVLVLNVGATSIFGTPEKVACLDRELPEQLNELLDAWQAVAPMTGEASQGSSRGRTASVVYMNRKSSRRLLLLVLLRDPLVISHASHDWLTQSLTD